ncbi:discoidin domain-containing receptor 2-like [Arctopsyche grandis]|uniref:discoidin domain-containing receptor 2-like n=1 Tax=Arctopsyche grandis TaxID=121162 RepID=UPI00406D6CB2
MNKISRVVSIGWLLILIRCVFFTRAEPDLLDMSKCNTILGMESGKILDKDISASSTFDASSVGPQRARLKHDLMGGAWCPKPMIIKGVKEYLEINLHTAHVITAIQTQGRYGNGQGKEYAEEYWMEYWRTGFQDWVEWKNRTGQMNLQGNFNTMDIVEQRLDPFIVAEKIRIYPFSLYKRVVCMRIELIGCIWTVGLVSYSMHQGVIRGTDIDLTDRTYDGNSENGKLLGGLGQLTDGQKGDDNFREDYNGYGKGYEWVGWRNDTIGVTGHVEILFEFAEVRNFTSMQIHTNNLFSKDVQVFSHVKVFFSIGGVHFSGEPVDFAYMPDTVLPIARYVIVKLHNRIGRYLRLHLYFASRWIMISEVNFDLKLAVGNFSEEAYEVTLKAQGTGHSTQSTKSWGDPFMRDEVPTTLKGIVRDVESEHLTKKGMRSLPPGRRDEEEAFGSTSEYLVVGILSSVAALLLVAIIFVSVRSRGTRAPLSPTPHNILPGPIVRGIDGSKLEDDKDEVTYHEPYQVTTYQPSVPRRISPRYRNVGQVTVHEYFTSREPEEPERPPPPPFLLPLPDLGLPELNLPVHIYDSPVFPSRLSIAPDQFYECINSPDPAPPTVPLITAQTIKKLESVPRALKYARNFEDEILDLVSFPWRNLKVLHPIGDGQFGIVYMCEVVGKPPCAQVVKGDLVTVQTLRMDCAPVASRKFDQHVNRLSRLRHTNVGRVLGCCREDDKPYSLVTEHLYAGDLNEFLQNRVPDMNSNSQDPGMTLSIGCLIYMAAQIASGMKYLEAVNFVHKDLATRNCLVGNSYLVKVSNTGVGKMRYPQDYYVVERRTGPPCALPIRWMSWESIYMDKFSSRSDSWAFGVTLWEMLTYGRVQPYQELSNMMVMENLKQLCHSSAEQIMLSNPINCPRDVYELMSDCWKKNESARPSFREIHEFLQVKSMGFRPSVN